MAEGASALSEDAFHTRNTSLSGAAEKIAVERLRAAPGTLTADQLHATRADYAEAMLWLGAEQPARAIPRRRRSSAWTR